MEVRATVPGGKFMTYNFKNKYTGEHTNMHKFPTVLSKGTYFDEVR